MQLALATEDCCAPRANVHYHLALFAVYVGKSTQASVALAHSVPKLWPHGRLRVDWRQWWKWKNRRTYRCQGPSCEDGRVFFFLCLLISSEFACCPFWESTTRFCVLSFDYHGVARAARKKPIKKDARPLSCPSSVTVFSIFFSKVLCGRRVESKTQEARMVTRLELCGRTMGVCKMDVTEPLVKGSARKYSDRGQTAHSE